MRSCYDVIETDNYVILHTLQNSKFQEYSTFVYQVGLKHAKPYIGKTFKTKIILLQNILNLIGILHKVFLPKTSLISD